MAARITISQKRDLGWREFIQEFHEYINSKARLPERIHLERLSELGLSAAPIVLQHGQCL